MQSAWVDAVGDEGMLPTLQEYGTARHWEGCWAPGARVVFPTGQAVQSFSVTPPSAPRNFPSGQGKATLAATAEPVKVPAGAGTQVNDPEEGA